MDKQSLKKKLHEQIDAMDDEYALRLLHEAAIEYGKEATDQDEGLSLDQVQRLHESIEQFNQGKWKPHDEVMQLSRTWLHK